MTCRLYYDDGQEYEVELYDHVEVRLDGDFVKEGVVTFIKSAKRALLVRYSDPLEINKRTTEPLRRTGIFPLAQCDLIARDE